MPRLFFILLIACASAQAQFSLATFQADITPPLGHALMGGGVAPAREIVDPLFAQGVVLLGGSDPVVWVSLDWCEVRNEAYDHWREEIARAAGTSRERVLLASIHQHDTPVVDYEAQRLLDAVGLEKALCDTSFAKKALGGVTASLRESLKSPVPVTHYGVGEGRVEGIASNRRVILPGGEVRYRRNSASSDPLMHELPEGLIDPMLKTLSFWDGDTPVAAMSTYATHPMSYYGKGGVTADFVGMARARRQEDTPEVFQMYFSGCSGDVTAGKFNDGAPENRPVLAERLHAGMVQAWERTERHPLEQVHVRTAPLLLAARAEGAFSREEMERTLTNTSATIFNRNLAALGLAWRNRVEAGKPIEVAAVHLGQAAWLLMPAESFVHYQLVAQTLRPGGMVLTAGYGECAPGYIPSDAASVEGFNDTHSWCWVAPGAEQPMVAAMRAVLQ